MSEQSDIHRCKDCGLLGLKRGHEDKLYTAPREFRETGVSDRFAHLGFQSYPVCQVGMAEFQASSNPPPPTDRDVLEQISVERRCGLFLKFDPTRNPAEHEEMRAFDEMKKLKEEWHQELMEHNRRVAGIQEHMLKLNAHVAKIDEERLAETKRQSEEARKNREEDSRDNNRKHAANWWVAVASMAVTILFQLFNWAYPWVARFFTLHNNP